MVRRRYGVGMVMMQASGGYRERGERREKAGSLPLPDGRFSPIYSPWGKGCYFMQLRYPFCRAKRLTALRINIFLYSWGGAVGFSNRRAIFRFCGLIIISLVWRVEKFSQITYTRLGIYT